MDASYDHKRVNAAVKIKISIDRALKRNSELFKDLERLKSGMTQEERNDYYKRIA